MPDETTRIDRPKLKDILASDELKGLGADAGMSEADIAKVLGPLGGLSSGVFQMTMKAGEAIGQSLGLKSSKQQEQTFALPYTTVVRALVLALASLRYGIATLFDTPKGAYIEAQMPKDFFSLGGAMQFDVIEEREGSIRVVAVTEIKGQMFDWGKGKRALRDVLGKTEQFARRLAP